MLRAKDPGSEASVGRVLKAQCGRPTRIDGDLPLCSLRYEPSGGSLRYRLLLD
jgi:hypothetical protein